MRIDKSFYLGSIYGGFGVGTVIMVLAVMQGVVGLRQDPQHPTLPPGAILGLLAGTCALLWATVTSLVLLYKAWESIQDGQARTTPGKAVGFMFIPLFNIYWMFQAIYGFAVDYNKFLQRRNLSVPRLNENLFLSGPLLQVGGLVPFLNFFFAPAGFVVMLILYARLVDAINNLSGPQRAMKAAASVYQG